MLSGPWIDGRWHAGGVERAIVHPWTGASASRIADATEAQIEAALTAAEHARAGLAKTAPAERAAWLYAAADAVHHERDAFADDLLREGGKPITLARAEVERGVETLRAAAVAAAQQSEPDPRTRLGPPGAILRRPAGVAAAITPFNFPLNLVLHKVGPALAAGCPVVVKPAPETPTAALRLGALLVGCGVPSAAVAVLPGDREVAARLVCDPRVRVVSFTGSAVGGRAVASAALGKRVVLELGGVAHAVLLEGTSMHEAAAKLAIGAFAHAGQSCISTQHIHVPRRSLGAFVDALVAAARTHTPFGDPADPATRCAGVQRTTDADRIRRWIAEAVDGGAMKACGDPGEGVRIPPHVLVEPPWTCAIGDHEVFGPVVAVHGYDDLGEALNRLRASQWGLQASLFGPDRAALDAIADTLDVGGVVFQDATARRVDAWPYGGDRGSGLGREGPAFAVDDYLTWQTRLDATTA
jgi:aldehyde dehydrogenase (NAD+)/glyceraldehyde-3-phosphate dehydrogenase (NADP+)